MPMHLEALGAVLALQPLEQRDLAPAHGAHQVAQKFTISALSRPVLTSRARPVLGTGRRCRQARNVAADRATQSSAVADATRFQPAGGAAAVADRRKHAGAGESPRRLQRQRELGPAVHVGFAPSPNARAEVRA